MTIEGDDDNDDDDDDDAGAAADNAFALTTQQTAAPLPTGSAYSASSQCSSSPSPKARSSTLTVVPLDEALARSIAAQPNSEQRVELKKRLRSYTGKLPPKEKKSAALKPAPSAPVELETVEIVKNLIDAFEINDK